MSGQVSDDFIFKNEKYELGAIEFPKLFLDWESFNLNPIEFDTSNWRGFINTFSVIDNKLVLNEIYTNNGKDENYKAHEINGIMPEIIKPDDLYDKNSPFRIVNYKNLNYFMEYTGSIIIVNNFIQKYYYHFDFQSPTNYKNIIKLIFDKGYLINEIDLSEYVENLRNKRPKKIKNKPLNIMFFGEEINLLFNKNENNNV